MKKVSSAQNIVYLYLEHEWNSTSRKVHTRKKDNKSSKLVS